MKKTILWLIVLLVLFLTVKGFSRVVRIGDYCNGGPLLLGYRPQSLEFIIDRFCIALPGETAVLCDGQTHSCGSYEKTQDSGDLQVIITADGKPVTGLEVDVADRPGAPRFYVKLTDNKGVALFDYLPAGNYKIYFNLNTVPKEYRGSAGTVIGVEVTKGQTTEQKIELE